MVKRNPDYDDNMYAHPYVLEEEDIELIEDTVENVRVEEANFSNPMNSLKCLYMKISSKNRSDLYEDSTMESLREIAREFDRDPDRIEKGNFPSRKDPDYHSYYDEEYYTLSIKFKK